MNCFCNNFPDTIQLPIVEEIIIRNNTQDTLSIEVWIDSHLYRKIPALPPSTTQMIQNAPQGNYEVITTNLRTGEITRTHQKMNQRNTRYFVDIDSEVVPTISIQNTLTNDISITIFANDIPIVNQQTIKSGEKKFLSNPPTGEYRLQVTNLLTGGETTSRYARFVSAGSEHSIVIYARPDKPVGLQVIWK